MTDDSVSAIDDKNKTEDTSSTNTSDWGGFATAIISNFIYFLLLVLIGSNFVFLVHFSSIELIFPTDINKYLPNASKSSELKGGNANLTTYARKLSGNSIDLVKQLGYTNKLTGWPYSMYTKHPAQLSLAEIKNWVALTEANTYIIYRTVMKLVYSAKFKDEELLKQLPDPILFLLGLFILPLCFFFIIPILTGISTIFCSFTSENMSWLYTLLGFFLVILLAFVNIILHKLSVLFNTFILPLIINYETVLAIAKRNSNWLTMVFGLFVLSSASQYLDSATSGIMTVAYIILLIKKIFF